MADESTQKPASGGEPSPAEKLAQPVAHSDTDTVQETRTEPNDTSADKSSAQPRIKPQGGVPVAKLSGIGIPVAVVLFVLAFLWKGPVFALGVLAAIALALAVIWAVRTIAARPATMPMGVRAPRPPAGPPRGGDRGGNLNRRQPGDRSHPWHRRPATNPRSAKGDDRPKTPTNANTKSPLKRDPAGDGSKRRPPGSQPGKSPGRDKGDAGKPGRGGGAGRPGSTGSKGNPANQPSPGKTPDKNGTKPPAGSKPVSSPPAPATDGAKQPAKTAPKTDPQTAANGPGSSSIPSRGKDKTSGTSRDRDRADRGGVGVDRGGNGGGDATKPNLAGEKPKKYKEGKKKTAETRPEPVERPFVPVDPRSQWVVHPQDTGQRPTDPKIAALAEKVRQVGGATQRPPKGVSSLEEKRHRSLGEAIRQAGKAPAKSHDQERFNAVYGDMIDLSTPESKARTLDEVSQTAKRDQIRLAEQAEELRRTAAGLPERGYENVQANLRAEAGRLDEDSETRGHWATATAERAEQFAAELNGVAI